MNWIKFKERYLFSVNMALTLSFILFMVRKDFSFHPFIGMWLILCCVSDKVNDFQLKVFKKIGHFNSVIILTVFYYLAFTPFSIFYKMFFRHSSFRKSNSSWVEDKSICNFDQPF